MQTIVLTVQHGGSLLGAVMAVGDRALNVAMDASMLTGVGKVAMGLHAAADSGEWRVSGRRPGAGLRCGDGHGIGPDGAGDLGPPGYRPLGGDAAHHDQHDNPDDQHDEHADEGTAGGGGQPRQPGASSSADGHPR